MDDQGHESGHFMLITPERVFYAGLLGRPRQRCPGALYVYVSVRGGLRLTAADGRENCGELLWCRRTCDIPLSATTARRSAS
jgi:hypothetical protein